MTDIPIADDAGPQALAEVRHPRLHVLHSASDMPCGVESFARRLVETAGPRGRGTVLAGRTALDRDGPGALVINLPVVAWKAVFLSHTAAALAARLRGQPVVVVLHEWDDLHPKRRASYLGLVLLATGLLFSCRAVEAQFARAWPSWFATRRRGTVPIPPNVRHPGTTLRGSEVERLAAERAAGALVLGYFGSIYPKKQPLEILDVAAELKRRGHRVAVVFVGSFIQGSDAIEREFADRVAARGLVGHVTVTGYIRGEAELFGIFEEVDVFVYRFAEGLTPRRGSVLACLQSGSPVVVNAPSDAEELRRHPIYGTLVESGALRLASPDAGASELADAVLAAAAARGPGEHRGGARLDVGAAWAAALAAVESMARPRPGVTRHGA